MCTTMMLLQCSAATILHAGIFSNKDYSEAGQTQMVSREAMYRQLVAFCCPSGPIVLESFLSYTSIIYPTDLD